MASDPREVLYQGRYFSIVADSTHTEFVRCGDEVLVVALTDEGDVLLTVEPSAAFAEPTLILPGGATTSGLSYSETADHELQEETGYKPRLLHFLGELRPFSKYLGVRSFVYLARGLEPGRMQGDEDYIIEVERMRLTELEALIASGRLLDARAIAALYMARTFLASDPGLVSPQSP